MTVKVLKKLQKYLEESIAIIELDAGASLYMSRKTLEYIILQYFDFANLEKLEKGKNYTELIKMIKKLKRLEITDADIFNSMEYIRKNGNLAVHFTEKSINATVAKGSVKSLSKVIVWFLEETKAQGNTLYLYAINNAKLRRKKINQHEEAVMINNMIHDLCTYSIFRRPNEIWEITDDIKKSEIIDDDIKGLIEKTENIVRKYLSFVDSYVEEDNLLGGLFSFVKRKKNETETQIFKKLYSDQIKEIKWLRKYLLERYF